METRVQRGDRTVTALFDTAGGLGGRLTVRRGKRTIHDAPLPLKIASE